MQTRAICVRLKGRKKKKRTLFTALLFFSGRRDACAARDIISSTQVLICSESRGGIGTNASERASARATRRSVTVLRAGRGRRTPKISVCARACTSVQDARRCSRCTPTSLCSPVTFAEAASSLSHLPLLLPPPPPSSLASIPGVLRLRLSWDRPILT